MDAKVYAMIQDMSRESLLELIASPIAADCETEYLQSFVRQQYETGQIAESDIIAAWDDDASGQDRESYSDDQDRESYSV
jgi:hypothetical protein